MSVSDDLAGKYILCLCEGNAELDIMDILLDHDLLVFRRHDLIDEVCHRRESVQRIQEKYLNQSFSKDLAILRIIDSRSEKFCLGKAYANRFYEATIITNPEIEILLIIDKDDYAQYQKAKSTQKPSLYCKEFYKLNHIKGNGFMKLYFRDYRKLLSAIEHHKRCCGSGCNTLYDLLAKDRQ